MSDVWRFFWRPGLVGPWHSAPCVERDGRVVCIVDGVLRVDLALEHARLLADCPELADGRHWRLSRCTGPD